MLGLIAKYIKEVSVLRRLVFAAIHLPEDLPNLWGVVIEYATKGKKESSAITAEDAKMLAENIQEFDSKAFSTDKDLLIFFFLSLLCELQKTFYFFFPRQRPQPSKQ